jgi:hypothetical protein
MGKKHSCIDNALLVAEAAKLLGVSPRRVRQLCDQGRLLHRLAGPNAVLVERASAEAFARLDRPPGRPRSQG